VKASSTIGSASPASTAVKITVTQTLQLLDGPCSGVADGLAERRYALWLGSGISRDRVDDLNAIIRRVLSHLRDRSDFSDPDCTYHQALNEAIALAQLSYAENTDFDPTQPITAWKLLPTILDRLRNNYARLFDIRIDGQPADHLLWDVVDVRRTFVDPGLQPDCEHLCIAILVIEGALAEIASANWDGLIELAIDELTDGNPDILRVCVRPMDFREPPLRARLMKFHGCAVLASGNPSAYRPLLVARQSQIAQWPHAPEWGVMRDQLTNMATVAPTLMVGLSAQDTDIQNVFVAGSATMQWEWPSDPPAYVFAEEVLGQDQKMLLKCVYRDAYEANRQAIEQGAQIRAFAKPLLSALVLHYLWAKLAAFANLARAIHLKESDFDALGESLRHLRDRVAAAAEPDRLAFIRDFISSSARALSLFREGRPPQSGAYRPLGIEPITQIPNSPDLVTSGLPEFAAALGLLGLGEQAGNWTIAPSDPAHPDTGVLQIITLGGNAQRLFFIANSDAALQLYHNNIVTENDPDVVIVYSSGPVARQPRSPRRAPGRTGRPTTRKVAVRSLILDAASLADLQTAFRQEAVL
jgi:hypothetical protein